MNGMVEEGNDMNGVGMGSSCRRLCRREGVRRRYGENERCAEEGGYSLNEEVRRQERSGEELYSRCGAV